LQTGLSCGLRNFCFLGEFLRFKGGKGVYNKGSSSPQLFFASISKIISKTGLMETFAVKNKLCYSRIVAM
jgi:hypothetical protein